MGAWRCLQRPVTRLNLLRTWNAYCMRRLVPQVSRTFLRRNAATSVFENNSKRLAKYPERLLIYSAGTGRTVFIGCLKVTTIFVFGFFCLVVAPARYYAHDEQVWIAALVVLLGLVPMVFVASTTAPFVTYIHLKLPEFARQSRENLLRYSKRLPRSATIDITTLNMIGRPRVSRVKLDDLHPIKSEFGIANYARGAKGEAAKRPWWAGRPIMEFAILGGRGRLREDGVWENVVRSIKNSQAERVR